MLFLIFIVTSTIASIVMLITVLVIDPVSNSIALVGEKINLVLVNKL